MQHLRRLFHVSISNTQKRRHHATSISLAEGKGTTTSTLSPTDAYIVHFTRSFRQHFQTPIYAHNICESEHRGRNFAVKVRWTEGRDFAGRLELGTCFLFCTLDFFDFIISISRRSLCMGTDSMVTFFYLCF